MKKMIVLGSVLVGILAMSFAIRAEEPEYKNLKVLPKNITKQQMDSVMQHFSASVGQKCNFCHVRNQETKEWNWASDGNKHKLIAREMMKMTNQLNKKYFEEAGDPKKLETKLMVTCYTCHNGRPEPLTMAPRKEAPASRPAAGTDSTRKQ
ncbi:c-type cytochrome [Flaviaesturariibacter amylovorans]|uniref:Photosynthetic reaction center cytochrome c subunit n=1 Tax=Flaviaesturariibacter amylovorans TaxID=1084520 RepID=A0ABP8GHP6_9BACT